MLNNSRNIYFYLVKELSTFVNDGLISANLGKTLVLTWTIGRCKECYIHLYLHSQHGGNILLFHVTKNRVSKSEFAQKKFGDRINVAWFNRSCKVELTHLKKNDTGSFSVQVYFLNSTRFKDISHYPSCISITGGNSMYRFISEFMHYNMMCFGAFVNVSILQLYTCYC